MRAITRERTAGIPPITARWKAAGKTFGRENPWPGNWPRPTNGYAPMGWNSLFWTVTPIACQRGLWDFYYREAQRTLGHSSEEEYRAFALTYIADPAPFDEKDSATWPAHTTGASVDLTLRELATGRLADMGSNFEEITETSSSDFFERLLDKGEIEEADPRLQNRRMMHWAMHEQGILNDPFVFWHHDWGNQHYVKTWRALFPNPPAAAWYGYIAPPPE